MNGAPGALAEAVSVENEALVREQFKSLTRLVPILYGVLIFNTLLLSFNFWQRAPLWVTVSLPLVLMLVITARLGYWIKLRRNACDADLRTIRRVMRSAAIMGPALSFGFTIAGLLLLGQGDAIEQSVTVMAIWVAASVSSFCLFAMPSTAVLIMLASGSPLCLAFLLSGNPIMILVTPFFATISGLMIYMLRENFRTFAEIVNSRTKLEETRRLTEAAREAATEIANTDPLTGLANRRCFDKRLAERLADVAATNGAFLVAMIDLDGFKPINDVYGHSVGDQFLIEVSSRVSRALDGAGLVARMGGDEFAVLSEGHSDPEAAIALGRRLVAAIDAPFRHDAIVARLRASCGIAMHDGSSANPDRLVERADIALYAAKTRARGSVFLFTDTLESTARQRAMIEQGLRTAVADNALDVHFQPIIAIATGEITGFEALARWNHPTLGPVSPAVFIPIAEQIGLIDALSEGMLRKAATIASRWPPRLALSFNLSADQLSKPSAGLDIIATLSACGLSPSRFEVEVTETAIMNDVDGSRNTIINLKNAGIRVSLDDFGTGYASLSQLRDLPLDKLKIDKSFVDRMCGDEKTTNLVRAIIGMCAHLDLNCVAEGIERADQMALLEQLGCASGQGYLISRPLPHDQIESMINLESFSRSGSAS
jgi:diguanylate cyclase (GGDEF)-like protein